MILECLPKRGEPWTISLNIVRTCRRKAMTRLVSHIGAHPGVHAQPSHYQKNLYLNSWWIAPIQVYQCVRAYVHARVWRTRSTSKPKCLLIFSPCLLLVVKPRVSQRDDQNNQRCLSVCKDMSAYYRTDSPVIHLACRPVQLPRQRLGACPSISDDEPSY